MKAMMAAMMGALVLCGQAAEAVDLGTVNFSNGAMGVDAPVTVGNEKASGPEWEVELLLVNGPVQAVTGRVRLDTNYAGYFFGGSVSVPGKAPGDAATFVVRLWHEGETVGQTQSITVILGGGKVPPTNLYGLDAMRVPGLPRLTIEQSGAGAMISWDSEFSGLQLQTTSTLGSGWEPAGGERTANGGAIFVPVSTEAGRKFFRLGN